MNYEIIKKLPAVEDIIQSLPLCLDEHEKIIQNRQEIQKILEGHDNRFIVIVGPCSAWPKEAVLEYAKRLFELNKKVKDTLKIVMRVYVQKPRTIKGWFGPAIQSDPLSACDTAEGIRYTREVMTKIVKIGLPIASEILFTHHFKSFVELLSWAAIGARSVENQEHRIFASAMGCPVGLKNPTHGSLKPGINGVIVAQQSHIAVLDGYEVKTRGNQYAHMVLRGNDQVPNYSREHLMEVMHYMNLHKVAYPSVIIDSSHDNCLVNGNKDYRFQPTVIMDVVKDLKNHPGLRKLVKGFMIESFLKEGHQVINENNSNDIDMGGLSITDPCLGWDQTEELLINLAKLTTS